MFQRIIVLCLAATLFIGCDESKYDPGKLNTNNLTGSGAGGEEIQSLSSLEQLGVDINLLIRALHYLYANELPQNIPLLAPAAASQEDAFQTLPPQVQDLVEKLRNENCYVSDNYFRYNGFSIGGELCPYYFSYHYGEGFEVIFDTYARKFANVREIDELDIDLALPPTPGSALDIDLQYISISGHRGDLDDDDIDEFSPEMFEEDEEEHDSLSLEFSIQSKTYGFLSGYMSGHRYFNGNYYSVEIDKELEFEDFLADDYHDDIDELCAELFLALDEAEDFLNSEIEDDEFVVVEP